ncbi:TPA: restriction endonuclease subunit S [Yersinia enterocolitica]|nr:restriction endonuclease subunit S [Yersinia enterocolitica]
MVPEGWKHGFVKDLANTVMGYAFKSTDFVPDGIPLLRMGNLYQNMLDLERNPVFLPKRYLSDFSRFIVRPGDLVMSMTGTMGKRDYGFTVQIPDSVPELLLNQRVMKFEPKKDACLEYLLNLFRSEIFLNYLYSFPGGTKQANLSAKQVQVLPVLIPPKAEQKKIAKILSTWDKAITTTEQLLTNSHQQKKVLRQQLLTGKKRFPEFNGKWERRELGKLLEYKQPTLYLVSSTDYNDDYEIPVLTAGKTFILGYTNELEGIYREKLPVIIFDDFTTDSKFVDFPFKAKSSAMKILTARDGVSIKYVFEAMQMLDFKIGGHQRHWISIFSNQVIAIPEIAEQRKIASALSCVDGEIEILKQKLNHLKQEKKALMQQLLTGKRRVKVDAA